MGCSWSYSLSNKSSQQTVSGDAHARLDENNISILLRFSKALFFLLRDILEISESDYKLHTILTSKDTCSSRAVPTFHRECDSFLT